MSDQSDHINQLLFKLEALLKRQEFFSQEIEVLKNELEELKKSGSSIPKPEETGPVEPISDPETTHVEEIPVAVVEKTEKEKLPPSKSVRPSVPGPSAIKPPKIKAKTNLEKFIGESLISKIAIIIIVLGVSIGAKYAIDNNLISPLMRIVLGYLVGFVLLVLAIRLKKKYENFSAVLLSGSMAILYFITYAGFSFYDLFPELTAFIIMVAITVFTVFSALKYDKQIIAHFGLVGAYAVPFLLSEDPGQIEVLFSYVAIINIGILFVAFQKYWKMLYYTSFVLSWAIYFMWYVSNPGPNDQPILALVFAGIYFLTFYAIFIAFKILKGKKFEIEDVFLVLLNTFIFYLVGYEIIGENMNAPEYLGLFTLGNALIHFLVSVVVHSKKLADKSLYYLIVGLVLLFVTVSIPVELSGNWITIFWVGEAALLFWIARKKNIRFYEYLAYPIMIFAFFSLMIDWAQIYSDLLRIEEARFLSPVFNIGVLTSLIFLIFFGWIIRTNYTTSIPDTLVRREFLYTIISFLLPFIFLAVLYNSVRLEISQYWNQLYESTKITGIANSPDLANSSLINFREIWILIYSVFFLNCLSFANYNWLKEKKLALFNLGFNFVILFFMLTIGLYGLSELREAYLEQDLSGNFHIGISSIVIRYIALVFIGMLLFVSDKLIHRRFFDNKYMVHFELILVLTICWIASSELLHWLDFADSSSSYKLALSIFWGVYSLILIALGIWKGKKHLRIVAIGLFGLTLIKLFFYDISHLDTISKTIVFVSLGTLLLIISFLYNKYKDKIL